MTTVRDLILAHEGLADLDPAARRLELRRILAETGGPAPTLTDVVEHIDGFGPLTRLLRDPSVTDVLVNGPQEVWVERGGLLERTEVAFHDVGTLRDLIDRWLGDAGARADASKPIADARMRDGSRLHVVLPPVSPVPFVSIRRLPETAPRMEELVEREMLTADEAELLIGAVVEGRSVIIGGATGTGKTTLLGSLLARVPVSERVVVLEETRELPMSAPHCVSLLTRSENAEGAGAIDLDELVRAALRMRPDRIVIGEVRGPEASALLSALSTGHRGSLATVHARAAEEVVERLVGLALRGSTMAEATIRAQATEAWDVIVHLERVGRHRHLARILETRAMSADGAAELRAVASLLRTGMTMRDALRSLGNHPTWENTAKRIRLGSSVPDALEAARPHLGEDTEALVLVFDLHSRLGGNIAASVEGVASSIEERLASEGRAGMHAAGARLSARMVACMPLGALLLLPGSRAPLLDPFGSAIIALGIGLCVAGFRWIGRLLPKPREGTEPILLLASLMAHTVGGGEGIDPVLELASRRFRGELGAELRRAERRHRLGLAWQDVLRSSDDEGLRDLGDALQPANRLGIPVSTLLADFVDRRRAASEREFEASVRRAPVKMIVPLTLCVLPSFGLLALTPFLRSMGIA